MAKHLSRSASGPRTSAAKQALMEKNFMALAQRFRTALAEHDYAAGLRMAEEALKILPNHMTVLSDYALCLMRTSEYEKAYAVYQRIRRSPPALRQQAGATWLDGLAEVCGWLGKSDELREFGLLSLNQADARYRDGPALPLPQTAPPTFDPTQPAGNVIAYSLFGANPRYCETMVKNAEVARELFAHWTCRVYLDASVPAHVQRRLRAAGTQVIDVAGTPQQDIHPLMWRFLVVEDPTVRRFLIRDADSLLSEREQAAVAEWLASPFWFHHMRDYFTHTELILAGLWGGCTGVVRDIASPIREFMKRPDDSGRFADQHFLRQYLWPTVRQSVMNHDELFGFHGARPFPAHAPVRWSTAAFHVGSNAGYQAIGTQASSRADGDIQRWALVTAEGEQLGDYASVVKNGAWRSDLPFFLVADFEAKRLRVELL